MMSQKKLKFPDFRSNMVVFSNVMVVECENASMTAKLIPLHIVRLKQRVLNFMFK